MAVSVTTTGGGAVEVEVVVDDVELDVVVEVVEVDDVDVVDVVDVVEVRGFGVEAKTAK